YAENFTLDSLGTKKLLVVPINFVDYQCQTYELCDVVHSQLEDAFFGEPADTGWQSVASFYNKSSYGKLTIEGVVTPFYEATYTMEEFANLDRTTGIYGQYFDPTWQMVEDVVAWYKTYTGTNLDEYDQDNDGFIDAVYMIYMNPNMSSRLYSDPAQQDVFWAYMFSDYDNYYSADVESPVPFTYAWSSRDFMYEGYGFESIDAHTYIHEMGHVLGLDDYYTYDDDDWGGLGGLDMMDNNILDHNAYSKFFYGWAEPIVIDGTKGVTEIVLTPFEKDGKFILINNDWNGTAFDEYLALEFYTPTGLNYKDSITGPYPGNNLKGFTEPGIKLLHVDARLGNYNYETGEFIGYTDLVDNGPNTYPYIAMSNTASRSQNPDYKLVHLLEENRMFTFELNGVANNNTLFQKGSYFTPERYDHFFPENGVFNDGSEIGYRIEIVDMSATQATIQIHRL
ncbi:MAG: hypothetical protein RBS38_15700, partial [Bacteroidales bacterium]|nr:hypothetical protein [Bacteroidales bacterium]